MLQTSLQLTIENLHQTVTLHFLNVPEIAFMFVYDLLDNEFLRECKQNELSLKLNQKPPGAYIVTLKTVKDEE